MAEKLSDHTQEAQPKRRIKCYLYDEPNIVTDEIENFFNEYKELRVKYSEMN